MTNRVVDAIDTIGDILWHAALAVVAALLTGSLLLGTTGPEGSAAMAPVADTSAIADVHSEGTDVILAFAETSPTPLWDGLLALG